MTDIRAAAKAQIATDFEQEKLAVAVKVQRYIEKNLYEIAKAESFLDMLQKCSTPAQYKDLPKSFIEY